PVASSGGEGGSGGAGGSAGARGSAGAGGSASAGGSGHGSGNRRSLDWGEIIRGIVVASMPGIGMLIFSAYLYSLTGRPVVWLQAHEAWGRVYEGVDKLFATHLGIIANEGLYAYSKGLPTDMLNAIATVAALLAVWPVTRRVGAAYGLLMLLMLLPPLARG